MHWVGIYTPPNFQIRERTYVPETYTKEDPWVSCLRRREGWGKGGITNAGDLLRRSSDVTDSVSGTVQE